MKRIPCSRRLLKKRISDSPNSLNIDLIAVDNGILKQEGVSDSSENQGNDMLMAKLQQAVAVFKIK